MIRLGVVLLCMVLFACKGRKSEEKGGGFSYESFSSLFKKVNAPYELSDTAFLKNRDTTQIRSVPFSNFIPDSLRARWFGKGAKVRYIAMAQIPFAKEANYYVVRAFTGSRKMALVFAFNKDQFGGVMSFLIPDSDPATSQVSVIDRDHSISKLMTLKKPNNVTQEGRDVYEYYADAKQFSLILTNPLNNENSEVINPIDTFPRKHKFSGDYVKDKKNFISIRDGRYPNQLIIFMHMEQNEGACTGELKGDLLLTSPTAAIYRQGGDPCVMSLRFGANSLTVKEDQGCGSHRGLDCSFNGSYSRKKEPKPKAAAKKK
jgi:hypothetical protein